MGTTLDQYIQSKGALPSRQAARIGFLILQKISAEFTAKTEDRPAVLQPSRVTVVSADQVEVAPGAEAHVARTSPNYASPEEAQGIPGDYRSQFYSFGCTLFEFIAGFPPFEGDSQTVLKSHVRAPIPDPSEVALGVYPQLADISGDLLNNDPVLRLRVVRELAQRLKSCVT
ncbi:MAG: hypothetical protein AAF517_24460, partial [Planctomycetota bacterium]